MHAAHLWLFFVVVFGIIILPGLDMAFVLGSALTGGRKPGLAAVLGIVAGGVCHVTMATLGISVLIKTLPGAYSGLLLAGALYLAWIGISMWRGTAGFGAAATVDALPSWTAFRRGLATCLLNPKAYLFTLAIFPQFLRPGYGVIWLQAVALWAIIAATQFGVYGAVAVAAGRVRLWLAGSSTATALAGRIVGSVLLLAAVLAAAEGWRGL